MSLYSPKECMYRTYMFFFFQAEDGIRDLVRSRGLGDVYKRQNLINSKEKKGFILKDGIPFPANSLAEHKYLTGIFDDYSKQNTKNYMAVSYTHLTLPTSDLV